MNADTQSQADVSARPFATKTAHHIDQLQSAIELAQLDARPMLISELTGLNLTKAKKLYREVNGQASPPGQRPFTDSWYVKCQRRMLHVLLIWRFFVRFRNAEVPLFRIWLWTYWCYETHVAQPLLDINRACFVPKLIDARMWVEQACPLCGNGYPSPYEPVGTPCPSCRVICRTVTAVAGSES